MKLAGSLLVLALAVPGPILARPLAEGVYGQTWASTPSSQCTGCQVRIRKVTPNIVELTASNGWSGFAYYVPRQDRYHGTFEWWSDGGPYDRVLFTFEIRFDGQMVTMNAISDASRFVATYKKAVPAMRETPL